jgi:hypothetical protein
MHTLYFLFKVYFDPELTVSAKLDWKGFWTVFTTFAVADAATVLMTLIMASAFMV